MKQPRAQWNRGPALARRVAVQGRRGAGAVTAGSTLAATRTAARCRLRAERWPPVHAGSDVINQVGPASPNSRGF